jgi:hypothetical protein
LALVEQLSSRIAVLERGRGEVAGADVGLLHVIATSTQSLPFRSVDLWRHAAVDSSLREAFDRAFVDGVATLGCWLRRMVGTRDGITVVRLPGRRWRVVDTSRT